MNKPYTIFNQTKNIPVKVWANNKIQPDLTEWDEELWVERPEDWYALSSPKYRNKRVRIVERSVWIAV